MVGRSTLDRPTGRTVPQPANSQGEYQAANADSDRTCRDLQAKLDAIAEIGKAFADVPWLSGLGLTVRVAFGCANIATG